MPDNATMTLLAAGAAATPAPLWPFALYLGLVLAVVAVMVGLSAVLGESHRNRRQFGRATGTPFEGGVAVTGDARVRFGSRFYLVAMFFVVFDLEAAFLFAWVIVARQLGWAGYLSAAVFIVLLLAALVYLWRVGALEFGPRPGRAHPALARGAE